MTSTALGQLPELCERLRPALEIILASYQVPFQDGEDLVQTTLLIAVTQWETIRSPRDWLPATLRNRCRIYWRERRLHERRQVPLEAWTREPATRPAQERCEALLDLDTLCRRLPARQRDVLCRSRLWNMKPADVARATGLAPASVRKTVHRAIAHLRWEARKAVPPRRRCRRAPRDPRPPADVEPWAMMASERLESVDRRVNLALQGAAEEERTTAEPAAVCGAALAGLIEASRALEPARSTPAAPFVDGDVDSGAIEPSTVAVAGRAERERRGRRQRRRRPGGSGRAAGAGAPRAGGRTPAAGARGKGRGRAGRDPAMAPELPAGCSWGAAMAAFLGDFHGAGRAAYHGHLAAAAVVLGQVQLAELTIADLSGYRAAVVEDGRGRPLQVQALAVLRTFLLWLGRQGAHALRAQDVLTALRLPAGRRATRRRSRTPRQ